MIVAFPTTDPGFAALPVPDLLASADALRPATADIDFSSPAGLLNLGLQIAFYRLQGTDAHIFSGRIAISARRQLELRWRLATFIGGLCCELHRILSHLIVAEKLGGEWLQFLVPLSAVALPLAVPGATLQYPEQDSSAIVLHLLSTIGGQPD